MSSFTCLFSFCHFPPPVSSNLTSPTPIFSLSPDISFHLIFARYATHAFAGGFWPRAVLLTPHLFPHSLPLYSFPASLLSHPRSSFSAPTPPLPPLAFIPYSQRYFQTSFPPRFYSAPSPPLPPFSVSSLFRYLPRSGRTVAQC